MVVSWWIVAFLPSVGDKFGTACTDGTLNLDRHASS